MSKIMRFLCNFFYPEIFSRVNFLTNLKSGGGEDDGDDDGDDGGDDGDDGDGNDGVEVIFGPVRRINDDVSRSGPRSIISSCVTVLAK